MSILVVAAARPNFMKVAPLLQAFDAAGVETTLVHTGQHYDAAMSDQFFADLGMRQPDVHLGCAGGSHAETTARVMLAFDAVVAERNPNAVVVVGDVDSTLACGLVAAKRNVPLAHVEAGLRSGDRTMPEEVNRIVVDALADWLFTPSADATQNLVREGVDPKRIFWVGNVMADSLLRTMTTLDVDAELARHRVRREGYALLTLHRPSNVDDMETFTEILTGVAEVARSTPVLFPVHPRTAPQLLLPQVQKILSATSGLRLLQPVGYRECAALQSAAAFVMTDSGGLQEETTILGVPCLTLRESTERPITVTEGTNTVVGTSASAIVDGAASALAGRHITRTPPVGWEGRAAERIVEILATTPAPLDAVRARPAARASSTVPPQTMRRVRA
ncbi:MAG TPA: UDP-N-acetylglucosamine 2-epimerase (non-hydrolyzing) [Mycobacteriales bacterium]|jgi:UDP-N-acetylglucosamine 2-epimerase (non-hydrolysing)|nr:UDP-N-acetylglucosamine 2-epimerase (non-hydrolyzing) [Mycobacteriales bacterium]